MVAAIAALEQHVVGQQIAGLQFAGVQGALVQRREIDAGEVQQFVEIADHEVALLEIVDAVVGAHHPLQVEADAVGAGAVEAELRLGERGRDAGTVQAQPVFLLQQAEFDGVPVDPRQLREVAQLLCPQPALAVGLMEDVTKQVGVSARLIATMVSGLMICTVS